MKGLFDDIWVIEQILVMKNVEFGLFPTPNSVRNEEDVRMGIVHGRPLWSELYPDSLWGFTVTTFPR
jgi:hypothetical protein